MNRTAVTMVLFLIFVSNNGLQAVVLSGNASNNLIQNSISKTQNVDGVLSFGFGGNSDPLVSVTKGTTYLNASISNAETYGDQFNSLAVQQDGKIVVGGWSSANNTNQGHSAPCYFALARFNSDGTLDETFGKTALGTTSYIPGTVFVNGSITNFADAPQDLITSIVIQPDGKIITAGYTYDGSGYKYFAVARFLSDGTLDASFGQSGSGLTSFIPGTVFLSGGICTATPADTAQMISLQSDGKFVLGGTTADGITGNFCAFARFLENGTLDTSFGMNSEHTTVVTPGSFYISTSISGATPGSINDSIVGFLKSGPLMAIDSEGNLIAVGDTQNDDGVEFTALVKISSEGELDHSFGGFNQGASYSLFPGSVYLGDSFGNETVVIATSMVVQPDKKIVLGAMIYNFRSNEWFFGVARFLENGALDDSFGETTETITSTIPGTVYISSHIGGSDSVTDYLFTLSLQNDGKIVAAGQTYVPDSSHRVVSLARLLPTGVLDESFGATTTGTTSKVGGTLYINNSLSGAPTGATLDYPFTMAVLPNGNIILAAVSLSGNTVSWGALAKFCNPQSKELYQKSYIPVGAGLNG